jgi:hypothetical protein
MHSRHSTHCITPWLLITPQLTFTAYRPLHKYYPNPTQLLLVALLIAVVTNRR